MTSSEIGIEAHKIIQGWCRAQNPICQSEVPVPRGSSRETGEAGRTDLFHYTPGARVTKVEVGEVKPIGERESVDAHIQLARYIIALQALVPANEIAFEPMQNWTPSVPPNGIHPFLPSPSGPQFLNCSPPAGGVYFYWCTKSGKQPDYEPRFVPIPRRLFEELEERIRRVKEQMKEGEGDLGLEPALARVPQWVWLVIGLGVFIGILSLLLPPVAIARAIAGLLTLLSLGRLAFGLPGLSASASQRPGREPGFQAGEQGSDETRADRSGRERGAQTGGRGSEQPAGGAGQRAGGPVTGGPGEGAGPYDAILAALTNPEGLALSPEEAQKALDLGKLVLDGVAASPNTDPDARDLKTSATTLAPNLHAAKKAVGATRKAGAHPEVRTTRGPRPPQQTEASGRREGVAGRGTVAATEVQPSTRVPEQGTRTTFPIWILGGVGIDSEVNRTYDVRVRIDVSPPFIVTVALNLVSASKTTGQVVLEVAREWYAEDYNVGSRVGARYTFTFPTR